LKDDRLLEMRVFKAVVDAGGFTVAAHTLGISQPFVSQNMTNLERRLGVQLLHRSTRTRRLTDEGRRFLVSCNKVIDALDEAEAEMSSVHVQPSGDLRVSAPIGFGMDQVVPRLPSFLQAHPQIQLHLSLSDAFANLIDDNVDVAIRMGRLQDSSLMSRKLCDLQRVVLAAPSYIAEHGIPRTPRDLANHNCLMWHGPLDHLNRWPFLIDGKSEEISVRGNFHSSNGLTLVDLCKAGVGIVRVAEHVALPAMRNGVLVPLLTDYQARDDTAIHAVFLRERQLLPRIRVFVDYLVEIFRQPPWQL
jgi:DNA-binding transcriptional LysR family regulator